MDYDDLEIERSQDEMDPTHSPGGGGPGPLLAAGGVVLLVAAGIGAFLVLRREPKPSATPAAPSLVAEPSAGPSASATPPLHESALPALDQSDAYARELLRGLSADPQVASWLSVDGLVRRFVAVVVNIVQRENPAPHIGVLVPRERLHAVRRGGRFVIDPESYSRFDAVAGIVAAVDAHEAARVYRRLRPLCDAAARELGQPAGEMDLLLGRALATLLAAPVVEGDVAVASEGPFYRFADNKLETLPPSQKQLIRMGPRNERLVQDKLKELSTALALPAAP
jgi:hypothetical protein